MLIKSKGWAMSAFIIFAVIVYIFSTSITVFSLDSLSSDTVILLGRVQVKWDGYAGKRQTDSSGFEILIKRTLTEPEELTEIYVVKPDAHGYFAVVNLPREGIYGFSKVMMENGSIPVPIDIFRPLAQNSKVLVLGKMILTVKVDGKIEVEINGAGFTATASSMSSTENPFIHTYFVNNFSLGGWLPFVKGDLEKKVKARKLWKEVKNLRERADKFKQEGQFESALREYLKIFAKDPDNELAIKDLVMSLKGVKQTDEVISFFCEQISRAPHEKGFYHGLAAVCKEMGRWREAIDVFQAALNIDPVDKMALFGQAECFVGLGHYEQAVELYFKVLAIDPDDGQAKREISKLVFKISNPAKKIAFYEELIPHLSDEVQEAHLDMVPKYFQPALKEKNENLKDNWQKRPPVKVYLKLGSLEKVEAVYQKAICLLPDYPDNFECPVKPEITMNDVGQKLALEKRAFFNFGELYRKHNNFTKALTNYNAAYSLQTDKTSLVADVIKVHNELDVYLVEIATGFQENLEIKSVGTNCEDKIVASCDPIKSQLEELKKGVKDDPTNASYHAALAEYYTVNNSLDKAVEHYQLAADNDSQNGYRLRTLADAWLRLGNNDKAEKALLAARKIKPDSSLSVAKLALFSESTKGMKVTEKILLQAVQDYPEDLELHFFLACFYERQGELKKALIEVHKILEIDDKEIKFHTLLGRIYMKMDRVEEALQEFSYRESVLRRKIAEEPQKLGYYNDLAWFWADENINLDEALLMAWESITLGWVYYQRGEYNRAVESMNRAIAEGADRANCFFRLSMALSRAGKKIEAKAAFETGKQIEPCSVLGMQAAKILTQKPTQ